jgi:hypothetical protein
MKTKTVTLRDLKPGQIFKTTNRWNEYIALFTQGNVLVTARTDHAAKMLKRSDAPLHFYTWKDKGHVSFIIVSKAKPSAVKTLIEYHKKLEKSQAKYVDDNYKNIDINYTPGGPVVKMADGNYVKAGQFAYVHFRNGNFQCRVGNLKGQLWNKQFEVAVMPLEYGRIDENRKHAIFIRPDSILYRIMKDDKGNWINSIPPEDVVKLEPIKEEKEKKEKPVMPKFTKEQKDRIGIAIRNTWETIGGDVLSAMKENGGKDYCTKAEMIEVCCDSDYVKSYGNDPEAAKWIDELFDADHDGAYKFLGKLFKFEKYG